MGITEVEQIIQEIDNLEDIYLSCKSIFPKLHESLIGKTEFPTAPYYQKRGYNIKINTGKVIDKEFINKYAETGNWINENSIIRLFGILTYHQQVGGNAAIDKSLPGWEDIRFCCWIRNMITKTNLNYQPKIPKNIELRKDIISYYELKEEDYIDGEIPTPIDKAIQPMFDGCRNYLRAKYKRT